MPTIFLSYRREDSRDIAGRIFDHLAEQFGTDAVFMDVDNIPVGVDFKQAIDQAVSQTDVLLVIIGPDWMARIPDCETAKTRHRLDDPGDLVRLEVQTALRRAIPIIPVVVGGANMPGAEDLPTDIRPLAFRNAATVRSGRDYRSDMAGLIEAVRTLAGEEGDREDGGKAEEQPPAPREERVNIGFDALVKSPAMLSGRKIASYKIRELLGAGGSGAVYRAINTNVGQEVCIKISYPMQSDPAVIRNAVSRGIRGVVRLNHPNIARIYDFDNLHLADGSSFFVVMELVLGKNLGEWTRALSRSEESVARRLGIAHTIATTLHAAHTCRYFDEAGFEMVGVMHGDIKPTNILVRPDDTPVVNDFMLVDVQLMMDTPRTEEVESYLGIDGEPITAVFGTPGYMAPEQESEGIVSVATDIFGLGMTLCDLFFMTRGPNAVDETISDDILDSILGLLKAMVSKTPAARPADMMVVAEWLAAIARDHGIESPAVTPNSVADANLTNRRETPDFWQRLGRFFTGG